MTLPNRTLASVAAAVVIVTVLQSGAAMATEHTACRRAVVFTLPGVTWADVARWRPPSVLRVASEGAVGSVSVRTNTARTSHSSGFTTIGAGVRADGGRSTGGPAEAADALAISGSPVMSAGGLVLDERVRVAGLDELAELALRAGYHAVPGALANAAGEQVVAAIGNGDRGIPPPVPAGLGRFALLAAMDARGVVDVAATGSELLETSAEAPFGVQTRAGAIERAVNALFEREPCASAVIDQGDLLRADEHAAIERAPGRGIERALLRADSVLAHVLTTLDVARDLLLVVSPTSPAAAAQAHLGVAIAWGPGFDPGSVLESATTRRTGIVTLPDVGPTVLAHLDIRRPPEMLGRPFFSVDDGGEDRVGAAKDLDAEAVFVDRLRIVLSTSFVVAQVIVYVLIAWLMRRSGTRLSRASRWRRGLEVLALGVVAFPLCTYLAGAVPGHRVGSVAFVGLLLVAEAVLLGVVARLVASPLERLLALAAATLATIVVDLVFGGPLQMNTVFGYSPIVAGRFAGLGNVAYAALAASTILTAALVVHRAHGSRASLAAAGAIFAVAVIADGAPALGSDVGGVLALVPGFFITWLLLAGRRPSARTLSIALVTTIALLAVFLAIDLARPEESRTHLARLFEDVRDRGSVAFTDTVARKVRTNLRIFTNTIWTYVVPPALAVMAWLLLRPRRRWEALAREAPRLRAGLVGGLAVAVLGFLVNDSGIVVPAVMLSFLVPMTLLVHLSLEDARA